MARKKKADTTSNGSIVDASLILDPYLYLGPRSSTSASFLTAHGITTVLSLGVAPSRKSAPGVIYHRLSLQDDPSASLDKVIDAANALIIESCGLRTGGPYAGKKILIHCSAGISRSPTIAVAFLVKVCGLTLKDALGRVVRARPVVRPNAGFFDQLKRLEISVRSVGSLDGVEEMPVRRKDRLALFAEP
ncbi:hypothetical protein H0H87_008425 [Tephrocybe sp. NHM501043]|nr:hypothetical protein H0H87_008425 [Tephrocybe sp. NHM501043]